MSHHLKILTDAGLVRIRQAGQQHILSVDTRLVAQLTDYFPRGLRPPTNPT
jgi:DNA-binding transcriptional ArsR family regulator